MTALLIFGDSTPPASAPELTVAVAEQPAIGSDNVLMPDDRAPDVIEQHPAVAQKPALGIAGEFKMKDYVVVLHSPQSLRDHAVDAIETLHASRVCAGGRPHDKASAGSILMPHEPHTR